jgi:hypothetical protein
MSYTFVATKTALAYHNNIVNDKQGFFAGAPAEDSPYLKTHVKYEGVYVPNELYNFCEQTKRIFRGATFVHARNNRTTLMSGVATANELSMIMPNQPYVVAVLGFANYTENTSAPPTYMVKSRTINNEKYRANSENYHSVMSKDIERAIANVRKYVRQLTVVDMAPLDIREFVSSAKEAPSQVHRAWSNARDNVRSSEFLYKELKHLLESGHQFLSATFQELAEKWVTAAKEYAEEKARMIPASFVHVTAVRDVQYFDAYCVSNIKDDDVIMKLRHRNKPSDEDIKRYTADTLPEDLMGKLSVLSMLNDGAYVEGVGKRVGETLYWVEGV